MTKTNRDITTGFCAFALLALTATLTGGGEMPYAPQLAPPPAKFAPPPQAVAPPAADVPCPPTICRDWPLPAPKRKMGWGFNLNEFYGPTYYYPSPKLYESNNPSYYPHYLPRFWPNYKTPGVYEAGYYPYSSRSGHYWDNYDDWVRDGRYGEYQ
jgi:hypothetical protein